MTEQGILKGTGDILDAFFGVQEPGKQERYKTRTTFTSSKLKDRTGDFHILLPELMSQIEYNWKHSTYIKSPGKKNWVLRQRPRYIDTGLPREIVLERKIVTAVPNWFNQTPTCSGFCGKALDKHRQIDLVEKVGQTEYGFYELKWATPSTTAPKDTPLYAAIEVLFRGLLYIFTRRYLQDMKYAAEQLQMFQASTIQLRVLAPFAFYQHLPFIDLTWMETRLDNAVRAYAKDTFPKLEMSFIFEMFPQDFGWPFTEDSVRKAVAGKTPAYPQQQ